MDVLLACLRAMLVGGALCALAQTLLDRTALTPARILVTYVVAGVALGALGWYDPLRRFAGCGVTLPLVGFGGAIAEGVRRAVGEHFELPEAPFDSNAPNRQYPFRECPLPHCARRSW